MNILLSKFKTAIQKPFIENPVNLSTLIVWHFLEKKHDSINYLFMLKSKDFTMCRLWTNGQHKLKLCVNCFWNLKSKIILLSLLISTWKLLLIDLLKIVASHLIKQTSIPNPFSYVERVRASRLQDSTQIKKTYH